MSLLPQPSLLGLQRKRPASGSRRPAATKVGVRRSTLAAALSADMESSISGDMIPKVECWADAVRGEGRGDPGREGAARVLAGDADRGEAGVDTGVIKDVS